MKTMMIVIIQGLNLKEKGKNDIKPSVQNPGISKTKKKERTSRDKTPFKTISATFFRYK